MVTLPKMFGWWFGVCSPNTHAKQCGHVDGFDTPNLKIRKRLGMWVYPRWISLIGCPLAAHHLITCRLSLGYLPRCSEDVEKNREREINAPYSECFKESLWVIFHSSFLCVIYYILIAILVLPATCSISPIFHIPRSVSLPLSDAYALILSSSLYSLPYILFWYFQVRSKESNFGKDEDT